MSLFLNSFEYGYPIDCILTLKKSTNFKVGREYWRYTLKKVELFPFKIQRRSFCICAYYLQKSYLLYVFSYGIPVCIDFFILVAYNLVNRKLLN